MFSHVSGPMAPVAGRPVSDWITETEFRVAGPKMPSTVTAGTCG